MITKSILRVFVCSSLALGLTACPNLAKPAQSKSGAAVKRVKGDPNVFIKDRAMNGLTALPAGISTSTAQWEFDVSGFQEENAITDLKSFVRDQTPKDLNGPASYPLVARVNGDQLSLEGTYKGFPARFDFSRQTNGWILNSFKLGTRGGMINQIPQKIVHTSVLPDLTAFTFLLQDRTPGKAVLWSLTFVRRKNMIQRAGDKIYEYIFGKGVKVAWNKQKMRTLLICGNLPEPLARLVQEEARRWTVVLEGKLNFQTSTRPTCPPFSDLNTQTFTFVRDWIEIVGEPGVMAQTLNIAGEGRGEFIDADVIYLLGEYQEALWLKGHHVDVLSPAVLKFPHFQATIRQTALHEIGHFLGLHHQFDPAIPSIMSYDDQREMKLYDYDIRAIQSLYAD